MLELVTGFLPPWYTDSEVERVDWLNKVLDKVRRRPEREGKVAGGTGGGKGGVTGWVRWGWQKQKPGVACSLSRGASKVSLLCVLLLLGFLPLRVCVVARLLCTPPRCRCCRAAVLAVALLAAAAALARGFLRCTRGRVAELSPPCLVSISRTSGFVAPCHGKYL